MEIGDMIYIYDEDNNKIKVFELKAINKSTIRVEKNWGKTFNSFPLQKDEENKSWFTSKMLLMSSLLDSEFKNLRSLKRGLEKQKKKLEELKTLD